MRKTSKKLIIRIMIAMMITVVVFLAIKYLTYERQPLPQALAAVESDQNVTVSRYPWLSFTPKLASSTGFIFYPGGRISFLGYSDLMRSISEQGFTVIVPKIPLNMAVFNANIADKIIAAHPEIKTWVIGGHSVGGTAAAMYTSAHPENIDGLAIWSSFPAESSDLSKLNIPVVLLFGGNETGVTDESVGARKHLLPADTLYVKIEGGDHHQFGSYELTTEENMATTSREVQHEQILSTMFVLLNKVDGGQ
ncbi:MAG: alpha/beta hydrolase [Chloroflexi bacterium HGW-Chloroflexi-10]|nr:MAG: alpha/beta hydrolase [Chloroflexi bacterium HGW-Chloroflexi-10]